MKIKELKKGTAVKSKLMNSRTKTFLRGRIAEDYKYRKNKFPDAEVRVIQHTNNELTYVVIAVSVDILEII